MRAFYTCLAGLCERMDAVDRKIHMRVSLFAIMDVRRTEEFSLNNEGKSCYLRLVEGRHDFAQGSRFKLRHF